MIGSGAREGPGGVAWPGLSGAVQKGPAGWLPLLCFALPPLPLPKFALRCLVWFGLVCLALASSISMLPLLELWRITRRPRV